MIDKGKLDEITIYLKEHIFRNGDVMYGIDIEKDDICDLTDIIASLHNLLYEAVTGEKYDYMWHWANKCGAWCDDHFFDDRKNDETIEEHRLRMYREYDRDITYGKWNNITDQTPSGIDLLFLDCRSGMIKRGKIVYKHFEQGFFIQNDRTMTTVGRLDDFTHWTPIPDPRDAYHPTEFAEEDEE